MQHKKSAEFIFILRISIIECIFAFRLPEQERERERESGILIVGGQNPRGIRHEHRSLKAHEICRLRADTELYLLYFCNNSALSVLSISMLHQMLDLEIGRLRMSDLRCVHLYRDAWPACAICIFGFD